MLLSLLRCSGSLQGQCYVIVRVFWVVIGNCYVAGVLHLQGVFKHLCSNMLKNTGWLLMRCYGFAYRSS